MNIIVAYDENRGIGFCNQIPWNIKEDKQYFKSMTMGNIVIMGYNTWKSIGYQPLKGRYNVIISHSTESKMPDKHGEIVKKIPTHFPPSRTFIIGGEKLYKQALDINIVKRVYVTVIEGIYQCDTFFPPLPFKDCYWEKINTPRHLIRYEKSYIYKRICYVRKNICR